MDNQITEQLQKLKSSKINDYAKAQKLYQRGNCQILAHARQGWDVLITDDHEEETEVKIRLRDDNCFYFVKNKPAEWDIYGIAALLQIQEELESTEPKIHSEGKAYTREGMMKRVLEERREKAAKANYRIAFADNIYGEHVLTNEKGVKYKITLRDFKNETGYIDNPDLKTNKLGTTKHIMYAFDALKSKPRIFNKLSKQYPFVEIYLDPLHDYRISWFYPHQLNADISGLIKKYFGTKTYLEEDTVKDFLLFIRDSATYPQIKIRSE
ncbi:MAG: hypothetical protein ACRDE2_03840, partial [Chitinophagaceae bacterium]